MTCPGQLVRIDDTSLWVVERGPSDGLPLIVLHGGPGLDHHEFGAHLDPLIERGMRLLLTDLRANGRSEPCPPSTWTLERMAQDVIMLALALKLGRYAVLGHSYGAFVALQNAVDYPGMAAATIVSGGVPSTRWLEEVGDELAAFEPEELREQVATSWDREAGVRTPDDVASLMHDQWPFHFADPRDPRLAEYEVATAGAVYAPDVLRHFATASTGGIEVEDRLGEVTQPVLVLAGRHDRVCSVQAAEHMIRLLPNAQLRVFEHSAHMMFVEEPDAYVDAVAGFLTGV
jgi:pimeloyl-ACP methyl ester carboxylesterase